MEFNKVTAAIAFIALIAISVGGLLASGMMAQRTILMMVLPSMVIFGAVAAAIGYQYGTYQASH